jgi:hypothetical protein
VTTTPLPVPRPSRRRRLLRTLAIVLVAPAAFTLGWATWATVAWLRYGNAATGAAQSRDSILARFMPAPEVAERNEREVSAPPGMVYRAALAFDLRQSGVVRAIFRGREILLRQPHPDMPASQSFVTEAQGMGWRLLAEVPGREMVFGAVTQPWQGDVHFRGLPPDHFASFDSSGYAKIIWAIAVDSLAPARSRVRTETRVVTTDPGSRARFRRYWAWFSPGIVLIRYEALRTIRTQAERAALSR